MFGAREEAERIVSPSTRDRRASQFDWLLDDEEDQPEMFMPVDMHHYDEEDYRDHRHRAYPHMHQPLKSMEPRVLMEIKTRIKANKRAEERAAKAGVATCVPALLASASDTRVLIDVNSGVSGPVLSLVHDPEPSFVPVVSRKKRKRKRKRSKKPEPFQPTLCKLSEESSSPLHSNVLDDCDNRSVGGLVLEELNDAMRSLRDCLSSPDLSEPHLSTRLSFLDEISSSDLPIGFLDMANHRHAKRQNSLPFFENISPTEILDNMNVSQSVVDLKKQSKHLQFMLPCDENVSSLITLSQDCETDSKRIDDVVDYIHPSSTQIIISPTTHSRIDLNIINLNEVASIPAVISESSLKISNCNFQIGSVDNVTETQINPYNVEVEQSPTCHRSVSQPVEYVTPDNGHHGHHHYHHHKEHYNKRDLDKRTFSGQDMRSLWKSKDAEDVDEYESTLGDAIIDDMRNHRCYDMPALNRTRIHNRYVNSNRRILHRSRSVTHPRTEEIHQQRRENIKKCTTYEDDGFNAGEYSKSQQDLIFQSNVCAVEWNSFEAIQENPLPLFVEMDILKPNKYWREISRWVRYEQSYNELSDTFGRAHSSPLKFTAFTQFRVQLENAIFLPHVEAKTFDEIINILTEELLVAQLFTEPKDSVFVKEVFKWRHIHAGEKIINEEDENNHAPFESAYNLSQNENNECNMRLINTSPVSFNNSTTPNSFSPVVTKISFDHIGSKTSEPNFNSKLGQHSNFPSMIKMLKNSIPILRHPKYPKSDLEGHLPPHTEGVTVQVGALESLKKPFLAILRLKSPMLMDRVTELNLPIRFLIVCLGPSAKIQYEEMGRVISTMLINKDFCKLMYRATDKCEIIEGLYKYLDSCFVLSYAGPRPTKNMHSMVDHINDFVRVKTNLSPLHFLPKESEGIKHSSSTCREQKSQSIKRGDLVRFDSELGGDNIRQKVIYEQSESDHEKENESVHVSFRPLEKKYNVAEIGLKKQRPIQYDMCCNLSFFLFRLLRLDMVKYKKRFVSDFKDAFEKDNIVIVLCGLVYLYFVCLSPALTFGVLLGDLVSNEFNVQMVLACNGLLTILFALVGGNPILVIGITGPMFLMETVIAKMASSFDLPIMIYRFVVAIYVSMIGIVAISLNITWVLQKVRRSVEECFNGFVGLYFIFKAALTIIRIFTTPDQKSFNSSGNHTYQNVSTVYDNRTAVGFASLVLAYSMYQICMALNSVNRGRFFTRKFRKMVDYFNVAIGILVLSFINVGIINMLGIILPTLKAETSISTWANSPSITVQFQLVSFTAHMVAFSLAFALMSLIFTETAISGITVTKAEKKLVKSSLFAQDQFMCLCIIPIICGLLGWPFLSGAAVRSSSHVIAMTKLDQKVIPGVKHKILGVVEQRVTMVVVGALILATVTLESVLGYVPTAAMLGMFLYMGVMGIRDLVVTRRLVAMFKRRKHWKDHEYLRDIPPSVLKSFEILQLAMIAIMFSMNCITEFAGISWTSFLIPVILLLYAMCRETLLPRFHWFAPHIDKLDPRHYIVMVPLCISDDNVDSTKEKHPSFSTRPTSMISVQQGSSTLINTADTVFYSDDGTNTSGDDIDSSSTSDLDP